MNTAMRETVNKIDSSLWKLHIIYVLRPPENGGRAPTTGWVPAKSSLTIRATFRPCLVSETIEDKSVPERTEKAVDTERDTL